MKSFLLKAVALLSCIALCASFLASCSKNDPTELSSPEQICPISAVNQKATDDEKIIIAYDISEDVAAAYDRFEVRVFHDDSYNNLLATTAVDPAQKTTYIDASYGKIRMELVGVKASDSSATVLGTGKTAVWADEYNFASLNATFPVVYFTLELFSMNGDSKANFEAANANGKNIQFLSDAPTFVSLERTAAYDWTKLPDKVHTLPNAPYADTIVGDFHSMNTKMEEYIKELYEVNPNSKFNFYCVDNAPSLIVRFFIAQGIENYSATMISDGTASVQAFRDLYEGADAEAVYNDTKIAWETIKAKAASGDPTYLENIPHEESPFLWHYALTMANEEENVQWWCSRDNFTKVTESQYMKDLLATMKGTKIQYFGINDMLSNLSQNDQTHLKELFHFDGEMFAAAEQSGKQALMIIGTYPEENLEGYLKLLQVEYGDEFVIYYKGHPAYPTQLDANKQQMFVDNGIIDIDATIAAELILFYCPDIYLTGYPSTTFKSALEGKFLAMFDQTKESGTQNAIENGYSDMPDAFYLTVEAAGKKFVQIESAANDTVRYFDIAEGVFVDTLPQ